MIIMLPLSIRRNVEVLSDELVVNKRHKPTHSMNQAARGLTTRDIDALVRARYSLRLFLKA